MFFLPEAPFDIVVYSFRTKSDGMPGRNLKTIQCGCVIDHAEAPNRGQQPSVSPQSPGWSVS
jgi:hypothetical protein